MDYVKINVDAAFREETMSGGWGAIGRDSTAEVCVAVAGILQNVAYCNACRDSSVDERYAGC
jgi:hypothetical protein